MKHPISISFSRLAVVSSLGAALAALSGCGAGSPASPATVTPVANQPVLVKAGTLPLIGSTVQVYAAGTTGNGSAGTLLSTGSLASSTNGTFTLPSFTCPSSTSVLYVIASGGATTSGGASNTAAKLGAVLGSCGTVSTTANFTVDEATTVAMAYAMSQFAAPGGKIGSTATNTSGIALAAATAANLVNLTTGVAPGAGFPATGTAPTAKINALANLLNTCIVSGASSAPCTQLFAATAQGGTVPTNTLDAMVNLAKQPGTNVGTLYALISGAGVYTPSLSAQPADWTLYATYAGGGMNDPSALSIDASGNVWVASYFSVASAFSNTGVPLSVNGYTDPDLNDSYGGAVNNNNNFWVTNEGGGTVTPFSTTGSLGSFGGGGMNFPLAVGFDTSGNGWIVNYGDSSVSLFSAAKTALSGASGYQSASLVFPVAVAVDAGGNAWVANQSSNTVTKITPSGSSFTSFVVGSSSTGVGPSGVAIDTAGNVWSANYYGNSVGLIAGGTTVTSGSGFTGGGVDHPQGIAADGAGTIWVANYRGLGMSELAGASAASPGAPLSPANGWGPDAGMLEPFALAIDASGNIWISNFATNTITEFVGMAAPVKTPLLGPVRVP
jgi:streptogramin lyase